MLMLMAGGFLVAGSDNPHFGTLMPLGPSTPSVCRKHELIGAGSIATMGRIARGARTGEHRTRSPYGNSIEVRTWEPPSVPPRRHLPLGMRSLTSRPSSTQCWRNSESVCRERELIGAG